MHARRWLGALLLPLLLLLAAPAAAQPPARARWNGTAAPTAIVVTDQARFTVLTSHLDRTEWSADGRFEDRPSLIFVNRLLPVPLLTTTRARGWLTIDTGALQVRYRERSGAFTAETLLYTASRKTYETGVAFLRPLYYDWPEANEAYAATDQYLFGDDLMIAPITAPLDELTSAASRKVWLPPGEWIEWSTGSSFVGPAHMERRFGLEEMPVYARAGAILTMQPPMRRTGEKPFDPGAGAVGAGGPVASRQAHHADRARQASAVRAAGPTARPAHSSTHLIEANLDAALPGSFLLGRSDPTDPLVSRQRGDSGPEASRRGVGFDGSPEICR